MKTSSGHPGSSRRGSALVVALISVTVVTTVGLAYLSLSATTSRRQTADIEAQQAFYLAEAGLAEAFQAVRIGRTGEIGSMDRPAAYGNGLLWVTAQDTLDGTVRLECTAMVGAGRTVLAMVVEPIEQALGFFADEDLVVESVLLVDGFDSELGSYEQQLPEPQAIGELGLNLSDPYMHVDTANQIVFQDGVFYHYLELVPGEAFAYDLSIDFQTLVEDPAWAGPYDLQWDDFIDHEVDDDEASVSNDFSDLEYQGVLTYFAALGAELDPQTEAELAEQPAPVEVVPSGPSETTTGSGGLLGSNTDVVLQGSIGEPVSVYGDVVPGPEGSVVGTADLTVTGQTEPRPSPVELPEVEIPNVAMQPATTHTGLLPLVLPPGEVGYDAIDVAADAELVLTGPATVVFGELTLAPGALLTLDTRDGPVDLYITGGMDLAQGSLVETTSPFPDELSVQVAAQPDTGDVDVRLEATSQFHGVIYAPEASVRIGGDFEVYGSVTARRLEIAPGARLHFDSARYEGSPVPELVSWRILELPAADRSRGTDPFVLLGVEPGDLQPIDRAHALGDVALVLTYLDHAGIERTFEGTEDQFDWTQVATILELARDPDRELGGDESVYPIEDEPATTDCRGEVQTAIDDLSGSTLRDYLIAMQPLSDPELMAFLDADDMSSSHHEDVLVASGSLSATVLERLLTASHGLSEGDLKDVLLLNSPLPAETIPLLEAVPLSVLDESNRDEVLAAQ